MRLIAARVKNYRSIRDTGRFEIELEKTILVGPNEAGKTAVLRALQQISPPAGVKGFDPLRDYPRALYNDISRGKIKPSDVAVVTGEFALTDDDKELIPAEFHHCIYMRGRKLDNGFFHGLVNAPEIPTFGAIQKDLARLAAHVDAQIAQKNEAGEALEPLGNDLAELTKAWTDRTILSEVLAKPIKDWLKKAILHVDEANEVEEARIDRLKGMLDADAKRIEVTTLLSKRVPIFVLYSNYFRVRPLIHLAHLAQRLEQNILDDEEYDYGNSCLLKLLGFTAKELSELGRAAEPAANDPNALQTYRDQLDRRRYQLNAASVRLTGEIRSVWLPRSQRAEADRLKVEADGQYLKVVVEDELGVEIELDQRSEGFQWLVSFFVVFFAEAADQNRNAILLLDEPGLSLHGLKQRDFRETISRLAQSNQTIYTTHSPFLVGPNELDLVRVIEMTDRDVGTQVHTSVSANDPAALLPLQEALGYDLAQSLFAQQRNLILEGLTDYWYVEAIASLLRENDIASMNEKIALVPANTAGKVIYFATILHAHNLKVAALLDSDSAGDQAASQEILVHKLGHKRILRTKDYELTGVAKPEIEDLLRATLVEIAKSELTWDVSAEEIAQTQRPIVDIFAEKFPNFSKYRLAKAFLRWSREHTANDLTANERKQWTELIEAINAALE